MGLRRRVQPSGSTRAQTGVSYGTSWSVSRRAKHQVPLPRITPLIVVASGCSGASSSPKADCPSRPMRYGTPA